MNKNLTRIGLICLALGLACKKESAEQAAPLPVRKAAAKKILAGFHYVGAAQLAGDTNGSQLRKVWAMPETVRFRDEMLKKLAKAPQAFLPKQGTNAAIDPSSWIRPLLDDLIQAESFGELREEGRGVSSFVLAVQLKEERAQMWSTNLWQAASAWQGVAPVALTNVSPAGWEAQTTNRASGFRFLRTGQWVVITTGPAQTHSNLLAKIAQEGRPIAAATNYWFDADVDSVQCQQWFSALPINDFPSAHVTVIGKGESLRSNVRLSFAQPIPWKSEPWRIPTNIIQNPENSLISFAAVRGVAPILKDLPAMRTLDWSPPPDQLFFWSHLQMPFRSYVAAPVANASNLLHTIAPHLTTLLGTNLLHPGNGEINWTANERTLVWSGLPIMLPHARPITKPEGEFLVAGLFPPPPLTNAPVPTELFASLTADTNACYYQWEITQERLFQWRSLFSSYYLLAGIPDPSPDTDGQQWLTAVSTNLGNSVTQVSVSSPTEMRLARNSHLGLTGLEIVQLAHWMESTNFPFGAFKFFPDFERQPHKPAARPVTKPRTNPARQFPARPPNKPKP